MKRYTMSVDQCGALYEDEAEDGDWVRWEDAEAEVTRLRQMYQDALRTVASSNEACATECAAHEATKAERDLMQSQKAALARRVLELEAQLKDYDDWANEPGALARWRADRAALSSVRELLAEELEGYPDCPRRDVLEAWLRAHPEPATPADPTRVYGGEGMPDVVLEAEPATPAATGEERQPLHRRRIGAAELQQRAEKEQKT